MPSAPLRHQNSLSPSLRPVAAQLGRDLKAMSRPQTINPLSRREIHVTTKTNQSQTQPCRDLKSVSRPETQKNPIARTKTRSRGLLLCRPRCCSVARAAALSCVHWLNRAPVLRAPRRPCHDTTCYVATRNQKWAVAPPFGPLHFLFFFFSKSSSSLYKACYF